MKCTTFGHRKCFTIETSIFLRVYVFANNEWCVHRFLWIRINSINKAQIMKCVMRARQKWKTLLSLGYKLVLNWQQTHTELAGSIARFAPTHFAISPLCSHKKKKVTLFGWQELSRSIYIRSEIDMNGNYYERLWIEPVKWLEWFRLT